MPEYASSANISRSDSISQGGGAANGLNTSQSSVYSQRSSKSSPMNRSVELRMASQEPYSVGFATPDTLEQCATKIYHDLRGIGYNQRVNLLGHDVEDTVGVLNAFNYALAQRTKEMEARNRADVDNRKLRSDIQVLERTVARLELQNGQKDKDIGALQNKSKQQETQLRAELSKAQRENEDLVRRSGLQQQRGVQLQHEVRRKEAAMEKLQDKLKGLLADRKKEAKSVLAIAGMFQQQASTGGRRVTGRVEQEEVQRRIIESYEAKKAELEQENTALKRSLVELQEEHKALLNHQLGFYPPPQPPPDAPPNAGPPRETPSQLLPAVSQSMYSFYSGDLGDLGEEIEKQQLMQDGLQEQPEEQEEQEEQAEGAASAASAADVEEGGSIEDMQRQLDLRFAKLKQQSKQLLQKDGAAGEEGQEEGEQKPAQRESGQEEKPQPRTRADGGKHVDPELQAVRELVAEQNNVLAAAIGVAQQATASRAEQASVIASLQEKLQAYQAKSEELAVQVADTNSRAATLGLALAKANMKLQEATVQLEDPVVAAKDEELNLLVEQIGMMQESVAVSKDAQQIASLHAQRMADRKHSQHSVDASADIDPPPATAPNAQASGNDLQTILDQEQRLHELAQKQSTEAAEQLQKDKQALQQKQALMADYDTAALRLLTSTTTSSEAASTTVEYPISQQMLDVADFDSRPLSLSNLHARKLSVGTGYICSFDTPRAHAASHLQSNPIYSDTQTNPPPVPRPPPFVPPTSQPAPRAELLSNKSTLSDQSLHSAHSVLNTNQSNLSTLPALNPAQAIQSAPTPAVSKKITIMGRISSQWQPPEIFTSIRKTALRREATAPATITSTGSGANGANPELQNHPHLSQETASKDLSVSSVHSSNNICSDSTLSGPHGSGSHASGIHVSGSHQSLIHNSSISGSASVRSPRSSITYSHSNSHRSYILAAGKGGDAGSTAADVSTRESGVALLGSPSSSSSVVSPLGFAAGNPGLPTVAQSMSPPSVHRGGKAGMPLLPANQVFVSDGFALKRSTRLISREASGPESEITSPTPSPSIQKSASSSGGRKTARSPATSAFLKLFGNGCLRSHDVDINSSIEYQSPSGQDSLGNSNSSAPLTHTR